jgi:phosphatidylserine decarboxylase
MNRKKQGQIWFVVHREGYAIVLFVAMAAFFLAMLSSTLGWIALISTFFCCYFFRNPDRVSPINDGLILSPADGVVESIMLTSAPKECDLGSDEMLRVSIFLSVFDVHVNRVPCNGKIIKLAYNPGKFLSATLDKSSEQNERQSVVLEDVVGRRIAFVQIAGLIARRIVCDLREGQEVLSGERFGIIKFGSRMDVYLPKNANVVVCSGQRMIGGETILANFSDHNQSLSFEVRR